MQAYVVAAQHQRTALMAKAMAWKGTHFSKVTRKEEGKIQKCKELAFELGETVRCNIEGGTNNCWSFRNYILQTDLIPRGDRS